MNIIAFITSLLLIPILDFLWLGLVATNFYVSRIGELARLGDSGKMQPIIWAAGVVYVLLALGVSVFVGPLMKSSESWTTSLRMGAILGLVVYGVYDFTNLSTLKLWPIELALADMAWGALVCGIASTASYFISIRFE